MSASGNELATNDALPFDYGDDEDEDELDQETEQDRGFVVDDDEEEEEFEEGYKSKRHRDHARRKKKKRKIFDDEDEIDEDDRLLITENTGVQLDNDKSHEYKKLKSLRMYHEEPAERTDLNDLNDLFQENEDETRRYEDESDNFIEYDDDDDREYEQNVRAQPNKRVQSRNKPSMGGEAMGHEMQNHSGIARLSEIFEDHHGIYSHFLRDTEHEMEESYFDDDPEAQRERLKEIFEPAELEARMMTDEDEDIRQIDVPERMQVAWAAVAANSRFFDKQSFYGAAMSQEEQEEQVHYVLREMKYALNGKLALDKLETAVRHALRYMHHSTVKYSELILEVPAINTYRRDFFTGWEKTDTANIPIEILSRDDLWCIWDFSLQYQSFKRKRNFVQERLSKLSNSDYYAQKALKECETVDEVDDVNEYLQFWYGDELRSGRKTASKFDSWQAIRHTAITRMIAAFGLNCSQFAENMRFPGRHLCTTSSLMPLSEAAKHVDAVFKTPEAVLRTAMTMAALQFSTDPFLKRIVRNQYKLNGVIKITPTSKGRDFIHESHPFYVAFIS